MKRILLILLTIALIAFFTPNVMAGNGYGHDKGNGNGHTGHDGPGNGGNGFGHDKGGGGCDDGDDGDDDDGDDTSPSPRSEWQGDPQFGYDNPCTFMQWWNNGFECPTE